MARFQRLACPSCAAPLDVPTRHEQFFTCATCGATLEDTQYTAPTPHVSLSLADLFAQSGVDQSSLTSYAARATRTASRAARFVAGITTVAVLGGAGAGAYGIYRAVDEAVGASTTAFSKATDGGFDIYGFALSAMFPGEESTTQVAAVTNGSDGAHLVYVDLGASEPVRWNTPIADLLPDNASVPPYERLVATSDRVLLTYQDHLYAFDRATGALAYQLAMPDAVVNICRECLRVLGGNRVAALTAEGTLHVWDATSGRTVWRHALPGDVPRHLLDVGGDPAVVARLDDGTYGVRVFAADDGTVVRTQVPQCEDSLFGRVHAYHWFYEVGDGSYIWHGGTGGGNCAQRWSPGAERPDWSITVPMIEGLGWDSFSDTPPLRSGDTIVMVTRAGLVAVDVRTGDHQRIRHHEDVTDLRPVARYGDVVALTERSTRGTPRHRLVGLDLTAPEAGPVWHHDLEGDDGSDGAITGVEWLVGPGSDGLVVATVDVDADSVEFVRLDATSGTAGAPVAMTIDDLFFAEFVGWRDGNLVLGAANRLMVIDPTSATVVTHAP